MGRTKKFAPGRFSHLPKSERPKIRDSKAVKEAKARKPADGPPSKKLKAGKGGGEDKRVKKVQASQQNIVPFDVFDRILCVGEGDLSFTTSLLLYHGCASVTSTTFDSENELLAKYPHVTTAIQTIEETEQTLFHEIDATKLSSYKIVRARGPFDRIFFMFPHVGGKSKDVNKQVRANQALLAGFFESAKSLLRKGGDDEGGSILVTLFEGEPYTLWNIRDLARSIGLVVKRSWRFQKEVYPGYRHARTLGVVLKKGSRPGEGDTTKNDMVEGAENEDEDEEENAESETAWRGENRDARTYEFGVKAVEAEKQDLSNATGGNDLPLGERGGKKIDDGKRKWNEDSSSDDG